MRKKRRIMSGLLALCIALSVLPLSACTAPKLTLDPEELYALPELPENVRGRWILENALSKAEQLICDDDTEIK